MPYMRYNLQFFQGEKTEQATPKKRRDAREKGQVVQSKDLSSSTVLLAVFFAINAGSEYFVNELFGMYGLVQNMMQTTQVEFNMDNLMVLYTAMLWSTLRIVLPILLVALVTGTLVTYMQVGFLFTLEPLKFSLDKISPLKGLKRMFSMKSLVEMLKSILKAMGILIICYLYVVGRQREMMLVMTYSIQQSIAFLWDIVMGIILRSAIFLFIVAVMDFAYKKWENDKELRMSKQDIKDEYKQTEGDPLVKSKIKEKQRQMAMSRMMQEVPSADVIITNPTHFAVALRYNREEGDSPKVVAKGKDLIAQNIKRVAAENKVPVVENKPLAQALYANVDIGAFIPPNLFEAVADVLAYVYQLKNRRS